MINYSTVCFLFRINITAGWDIKNRRQTPRISGKYFRVSRERFAVPRGIVTEHSEAVLGARLQVRNATLRVLLHRAGFRPLASAHVLHLHYVMFNVQTAVV